MDFQKWYELNETRIRIRFNQEAPYESLIELLDFAYNSGALQGKIQNLCKCECKQ